MDSRRTVLDCLEVALQSVSGDQVVYDYLTAHPVSERIAVIAIGKAAVAMWQGAQRALGDRIVARLVITKQGHVPAALSGTGIIESEHPYPGDNSLAAGRALLDFVDSLPGDCDLIFLISGGTSSLVEVLPEGIGLDALQRINRWLLGSGLDIRQVNQIRKRFSLIKGGRLATRLRQQKILNLLISDVPGNNLSAIGSGLLVAEEKIEPLSAELPGWLCDYLENAPEFPDNTSPVFCRITNVILADNATALQAAAREAQRLGLKVNVAKTPLDGDALQTGRRLAEYIKQAAPGMYLWGGETTVQLPENPGIGGRNQSLALAAALSLAGEQNVVFLSVGTDGTDGPTEDAGALVDGGTIQRGEDGGLNASSALQDADAGRFLAASGDLIYTGPTGTNVMDLVLALRKA